MNWPWRKPPAKPWYEEPGYIAIPPHAKVSIVQHNNVTDQDVIVRIEQGAVYIYTNKGTYLNKLLARVELREMEIIR